ncbi:MAG: response regulator [Burkholderiales bacterium]|nr:MAG: response regulator [Burkholderiales bacterium]
MAAAYTVALIGFAQQESATFESFFRMAARRPPAYLVQDEVIDAQILIVNADNLQAIHLVQHAELPGRVLLIGHNDAGTGWPLQKKPVKLVSVLAALDQLVGARGSSAPPSRPGFAATEPFKASQLQALDASMGRNAPQVARRRRSPDTEFPPTRPMIRPMQSAAEPAPAAPKSDAPARPGVIRLTDFGGLDAVPGRPPAPAAPVRSTRSPRSRQPTGDEEVADVRRGEVLLVAESLVEGRILLKRFKRYGLNIDWSREARQALTMLKAHPYRLVVIDRLQGEPDAFQVCRQAKQRKLPTGQSPVVIMFAPSAGSMDRMKASLAGSDAYLSRSASEADLYKALAQHRLVSLDGFEKTNVGF